MATDIATTRKTSSSTGSSRILVKLKGRQLTMPYDHGARDPFEAAVRAACAEWGYVTSDVRVSGLPEERRYAVTR